MGLSPASPEKVLLVLLLILFPNRALNFLFKQARSSPGTGAVSHQRGQRAAQRTPWLVMGLNRHLVKGCRESNLLRDQCWNPFHMGTQPTGITALLHQMQGLNLCSENTPNS